MALKVCDPLGEEFENGLEADRFIEQKKKFIGGRLDGKRSFAFGLTEPGHGSDATHSEFKIDMAWHHLLKTHSC